MKNALDGRDFITIGIFNAIGIVVYMAMAFALTTTVVGGFVSSGISLGIAAPVYLLMGMKIRKRGVFILSGILLGLFALAGGHIWHMICAVLGGLICDFVIGNYGSRTKIIFGYGLFALLDYFGTVMPVILFGTKTFIDNATNKWKLSTEQIEKTMPYFTIRWILFFGVITCVAACSGAVVAMQILKKHFKKAGVI
ncbi:MAG: MptD family putative ECF transporter S component [Treponema sp.]|nr:MptD family putative ECF transporter S component [Treponema sp.]